MKIITIKEPWATLIIKGYKNYEYRSWKTKYRGPILIHAAKTIDKEALKKFESYNLEINPSKVLGEVTITDCVAITADFLKDDSVLLKPSKNFRNKYGFKLENIKEYDNKFYVKGQLGIWNYEKK